MRLPLGSVLLGAGAVLIGAGITHSDQAWGIVLIAVGSVAFLLGALVTVRRPAHNRQMDRSEKHVDQRVTSYGQRGGQTARNIVNVGPQPRTLANTDWQRAVADLRAYAGTEIEVSWMNDPESTGFSKEIRGVLQQSDWHERNLSAVVMPDPPRGIVLEVPEASVAENPAMAALRDSLRSLGGVLVTVKTGAATRRLMVGVA